MKFNPRQIFCIAPLIVGAWSATAQTNIPCPEYHIYTGSTHAHTANTWSHGEQFAKADKENAEEKSSKLTITPDGAQYPPKTAKVKPDWEKFQGPPAKHYALAKNNDYDFYCVTDHSQEAKFQPPSPTNSLWAAAKQDAR